MSKGFKMADITNDLFDKSAAGRIVHTLKVPVFLVESSGPLSWEGIRCANQSMSLTDKQGDQKANYSNCQVSFLIMMLCHSENMKATSVTA